MKRVFLGVAAVAVLLIATETAFAQRIRVGSGYYGGYPTGGISYATRIGNNGLLSIGYGTAYPAWGYSPGYVMASAPIIYAPPVYSVQSFYYSTPSYGFYYSTRPRNWWGW